MNTATRTPQEIQARIKGRVWQSLAQSGVDISALPQADIDTLVNSVALGLMQEVDTMLGEQIAAQTPVATEGVVAATSLTDDTTAAQGSVEQILWEGRPFLSISTHYTISNERVRIVSGLVGKEREDIELVRIQDIDQTQTFGERMFDIGDITIRSHDASNPEIVLNNVHNVQEVHEILRRAVLAARKNSNFMYREQM